jgi:hypothetical protein
LTKICIGASFAIDASGGLAGRMIEMVIRDSKGQPQEAARVARELVNADGCEILIDAEASSGAFAVHEVARDLGVLCLHSNSETSSLTADPKLLVKSRAFAPWWREDCAGSSANGTGALINLEKIP